MEDDIGLVERYIAGETDKAMGCSEGRSGILLKARKDSGYPNIGHRQAGMTEIGLISIFDNTT